MVEKPTIRPTSINYKATYTLGIDPNRRGKDETAIVIIEQGAFDETPMSQIRVVSIQTSNTTSLTEIIGKVLYLHSLFNFEKIIIDTTGLGSGVTDVLKEKIKGDVVEEFWFTKKSKPELFFNLKLLMQQKRLKFPDYRINGNELCKKLFFQMLSITQNYVGDSDTPQISHENNTHDDCVCALALACWHFKQGINVRRNYLLGMGNRQDF